MKTKNFKCPVNLCTYSAQLRTTLAAHMLTIHNKVPCTAARRFCQEKFFSNRKTVQQHLAKYHKGERPEPSVVDKLKELTIRKTRISKPKPQFKVSTTTATVIEASQLPIPSVAESSGPSSSFSVPYNESEPPPKCLYVDKVTETEPMEQTHLSSAASVGKSDEETSGSTERPPIFILTQLEHYTRIAESKMPIAADSWKHTRWTTAAFKTHRKFDFAAAGESTQAAKIHVDLAMESIRNIDSTEPICTVDEAIALWWENLKSQTISPVSSSIIVDASTPAQENNLNFNHKLMNRINIKGQVAQRRFIAATALTTNGFKQQHFGFGTINYLIDGAPILWFGISLKHTSKFERLVDRLYNGATNCRFTTRHRAIVINPETLLENDIEIYKVKQAKGECVLTWPGTYSISFTTGTSIMESFDIVSPEWIGIGLTYLRCKCDENKHLHSTSLRPLVQVLRPDLLDQFDLGTLEWEDIDGSGAVNYQQEE